MIEFGQVNLDDNIRLESHGEPRPLQEFGLRNVEIQDKSASFAYHIPQGVLLSYDPQKRKGHALERRRIATTEIAPAILRNFGVSAPSYMTAGLALN